MIKVRRTDFTEVQPVWGTRLWDSRYKFEPTSALLFLGGYDAAIATKYTPCFLVAEVNGKMAGVGSCHATSEAHYRVRGLYIFEEFRGMNVGTGLLEAMIEEARLSSRDFLWAAPRVHNVGLFRKLGFKTYSPPTNEGFLYGPNCYMGLNL